MRQNRLRDGAREDSFGHALRTCAVLLGLLFLCSCDANRAAENDDPPVSGTRIENVYVDYVKDGDSIVVRHKDALLDVRLFGIDAPEKNQPYAQAAKAAARDAMAGRRVDLVVRDIDRYERLVAEVWLERHPTSVNQQLVAEGAAWFYARYSSDARLERAQQQARERGLGLWGLPESDRIAPWMWRKHNK